MKKPNKIVLAYSGGLDTSVILHWLKRKYRCPVIACVVDVGQGDNPEQLQRNAKSAGADKYYFIDARTEFVTNYLWPVLQAGAVYEHKYLMATSLARPLIAEKVVAIAKKENADTLAHGATGKGNDQVRFELTFQVLMPEAQVIAPWREWNIKSREEEIQYAKKFNLKIPITPAKPYSSDGNIAHISYEGGILESLTTASDNSMFTMTVSPENAPSRNEIVEIEFVAGLPIKINNKKLPPVELMKMLNTIAGRNGIGRVDIVENRLVGMKSRGVYESPGLTLLHQAHWELESLVLDRETLHYKQQVALKFAELVYYGQWYSPLRYALSSFVESTQKYLTGKIKFSLYKGNITVISRYSPYSLYSRELATFEKDTVYRQKDAEGFIRLFGLPTKVVALVQKRNR